MKYLAQGNNVILHGRESNRQPSDYKPASLTAQRSATWLPLNKWMWFDFDDWFVVYCFNYIWASQPFQKGQLTIWGYMPRGVLWLPDMVWAFYYLGRSFGTVDPKDYCFNSDSTEDCIILRSEPMTEETRDICMFDVRYFWFMATGGFMILSDVSMSKIVINYLLTESEVMPGNIKLRLFRIDFAIWQRWGLPSVMPSTPRFPSLKRHWELV